MPSPHADGIMLQGQYNGVFELLPLSQAGRGLEEAAVRRDACSRRAKGEGRQ